MEDDNEDEDEAEVEVERFTMFTDKTFSWHAMRAILQTGPAHLSLVNLTTGLCTSGEDLVSGALYGKRLY